MINDNLNIGELLNYSLAIKKKYCNLILMRES